MEGRLPTHLAMLPLLIALLALPISGASGNVIGQSVTEVQFSADDFDWREIVPYLFVASGLPGGQGLKAVLEHFTLLRSYVANELREECRSDKNGCTTRGDNSTLEGQVSKRIDEIVQEGIFRWHKKAIVDYLFTDEHFPFSQVAAVRSENQQDCYFVLELADRSYTAAQVQAQYGVPSDTNVVSWYSVYKYRLDRPGYRATAVFQIDPIDGAVTKVAISLKRKNRRTPRP